jgi:hypothetical protein
LRSDTTIDLGTTRCKNVDPPPTPCGHRANRSGTKKGPHRFRRVAWVKHSYPPPEPAPANPQWLRRPPSTARAGECLTPAAAKSGLATIRQHDPKAKSTATPRLTSLPQRDDISGSEDLSDTWSSRSRRIRLELMQIEPISVLHRRSLMALAPQSATPASTEPARSCAVLPIGARPVCEYWS